MTDDAAAVDLLLGMNGIDVSPPEREALIEIYRHSRAQLERHYAIGDARYEEPGVIFRARLNPADKTA